MHSISDSDSCRSFPCLNNATCYNIIGSYVSDSESCRSSPCVNNATCYDLIGSYMCKCVGGYYGKNCEHKVVIPPEKVCPTKTPAPNATCPEVTTAASCPSCPELSIFVPETSPSFPTQEPEPDVDHCKNEPCMNGGKCHNSSSGYICVCSDFYTGQSCETGEYQ